MDDPAEAARLRVFYSYSHKDERFKRSLEAHLAGMRREGLIAEWSDRKIVPGADWAAEIDRQVEIADIVVVLCSSDFINSDYCWGVELAKALDRQSRGENVVIPVIVRPSDWQNTPIGRLEALPVNGRAVSTWSNRDEAWADVAQGIRRIVEGPRSTTPAPGPARHSVEFVHVGLADVDGPQWVEEHRGALGPPPFGTCSQYFLLREFVRDADLCLDVSVLNRSRSVQVISAVGVEVVDAMHAFRPRGIPQAAKIPPATDEYVVQMEIPAPFLVTVRFPARGRRKAAQTQRLAFTDTPKRIEHQFWTRLTDPVYLPVGAPYRFRLRLKNYQASIPNHATIRLLVDVGDVASSRTMFVGRS